MSDSKQPQDASMEDILSSIRNILSTEDKSEITPSSEPLELTEVVETKRAPKPQKKEKAPVEKAEEAPWEKEPKEKAKPAPAPLEPVTDLSLMSQATVEASTAALSALKKEPEPEVAPEEPVSNAGLEDLVKSLLMPLLKNWVDQNLPDLVERVVREEIQKITK